MLLAGWMRMMATAQVEPGMLARIRHAHRTDVAVLPPARIVAMLQAAGFPTPVQCFQAGLIHAWVSRRS